MIDLAAADLILQEAGGKVNKINGEKVRYNTENLKIESVVASNRIIISELQNKLFQKSSLISNEGHKSKILISRICTEYINKHLYILFSSTCMIIVSATTAINAWMMQPVLDDIFINKDKRLMMIIPIAVIIIAITKVLPLTFNQF